MDIGPVAPSARALLREGWDNFDVRKLHSVARQPVCVANRVDPSLKRKVLTVVYFLSIGAQGGATVLQYSGGSRISTRGLCICVGGIRRTHTRTRLCFVVSEAGNEGCDLPFLVGAASFPPPRVV